MINKIDLPSADPAGVKQQIEDEIGLDTEDCPLVSAKQGIGIEDVLEAVVNRIPAPNGRRERSAARADFRFRIMIIIAARFRPCA